MPPPSMAAGSGETSQRNTPWRKSNPTAWATSLSSRGFGFVDDGRNALRSGPDPDRQPPSARAAREAATTPVRCVARTVPARSGGSEDAASGPAAFCVRVHEDGGEEDEPGDHKLRPRGEAEQVHSVLNRGDYQGAEKRRDHPADASEQAGATDHSRGDDEQKQVAA